MAGLTEYKLVLLLLLGMEKASMSMGNYLSILSLIALLLLDLLNSNLGPQLCESNTPKSFGEDVPELSSCLDILEPDLSTIDAITDEVILGVDVLALVVVDGCRVEMAD